MWLCLIKFSKNSAMPFSLWKACPLLLITQSLRSSLTSLYSAIRILLFLLGYEVSRVTIKTFLYDAEMWTNRMYFIPKFSWNQFWWNLTWKNSHNNFLWKSNILLPKEQKVSCKRLLFEGWKEYHTVIYSIAFSYFCWTWLTQEKNTFRILLQ